MKKSAKKLTTDNRGGLPDMRTPFARMPLKNDVAIGEHAPGPRSLDPLGYFPREDRPPKLLSKKQQAKRAVLQKRISKLERKLKKLRDKAG